MYPCYFIENRSVLIWSWFSMSNLKFLELKWFKFQPLPCCLRTCIVLLGSTHYTNCITFSKASLRRDSLHSKATKLALHSLGRCLWLRLNSTMVLIGQHTARKENTHAKRETNIFTNVKTNARHHTVKHNWIQKRVANTDNATKYRNVPQVQKTQPKAGTHC